MKYDRLEYDATKEDGLYMSYITNMDHPQAGFVNLHFSKTKETAAKKTIASLNRLIKDIQEEYGV